MNFKKTALILAMAGVTAAPMAAQADVYASVRIGLENVDTGGVSDVRMRSFGSRFGIKSETELDGGMIGWGKYEWDVDFRDHNEDVNAAPTADGDKDDIDIRHRVVGVKGDFGSAFIGQTYHTFYNFVVGPTDNPWWGSGYNMVRYGGRTDGGVTYAGGSDGIKYGVTAYFEREAGEDLPDGTEIGVSFGIGDMTLGLAMQDSEAQTDAVIGAVLTGIELGGASLGVGFQSQDDDSSLLLDVGIGNVYVHYETKSDDAASTDATSITVGYTQGLGRNTTAWYEFVTNDADSGNSDDDLTVLRATLKYNIM